MQKFRNVDSRINTQIQKKPSRNDLLAPIEKTKVEDKNWVSNGYLSKQKRAINSLKKLILKVITAIWNLHKLKK